MGDFSRRQASMGVQVLDCDAREIESPTTIVPTDVSPRLRPTRWLRLRIVDEGEKVISIKLPWIICSGALGLTGWLVRCVPRAVEVIEEEIPGGAESVDAVLRAIRQVPAGTRIEVQDDTSYVLIECR